MRFISTFCEIPHEALSAKAARASLQKLGLTYDVIERVEAIVLATKDHQVTDSNWIANSVFDADMAILGTAQPIYEEYCRGVRLEYSIIRI